jgi:hypothetical protein
MPSHAASAQSPAIQAGQEGAKVISVGVRKILPAATQESRKMDKVPLVTGNTVGRKTLFHTCVVKVVMDFGQPQRRMQSILPTALCSSPANHFACRLRIKTVRSRSVFLLGFASSAGHSRHFASGVEP